MLFSATQTAKVTDLSRVLLKKDVDVHENRDTLTADGLEQDIPAIDWIVQFDSLDDSRTAREDLRSTYDRLDSKSTRWVKEHNNWNEDQWRNIVWSDESRFCVEGSSYDITILANRIHLWFTDVMVHQKRDFIIQEDGASCHTGGYARWWKEAHQIRDFAYRPAQSPDLNSKEHV
ncbi:hypothetical protein G6F37_010243 [Rhizopus arrhizus]|nr:hypothetical protein G6F38_009311 [Rhizopus arrhizus]KAG1153566.1 hypothetical protein G6F37_010243 [Rhizopus arrhizus]